MRIAVITPVKNEADNLPKLISSVKNQILSPSIWVLVNDNSTDNSQSIIDRKQDKTNWIHGINRITESESEYDRSRIGKILDDGYRFLEENTENEYDYYMILDADMQLTPNYLGELTKMMETHESIAIGSGGIYIKNNNEFILEQRSKIHPSGGATLYDGEFIRSLGGFLNVPDWDSATEIKARLRGYTCRYFTKLEGKAIQSRSTGSKNNQFSNALTSGKNCYISGFHPVLILLKSLNKTRKPPYYSGIAFFLGYTRAYILNYNKIDDDEIIHFNRKVRPKLVIRQLSAKISMSIGKISNNYLKPNFQK